MSDDVGLPQRRSTDLPPDAPWWARWLVANVAEAWKWASMWWPATCAAAAEVYAINSDTINTYIRDAVPSNWWPHIVAASFAASMLCRVLRLTHRPATAPHDVPASPYRYPPT